MEKERVIQIIYNAIDEINQQQPPEKQLEKSTDTILFGKTGKLDSLGLVNLIVSTEQEIEDEFDLSITIADEKAMSQEVSPFKSVERLADYVCSLIEECK